MKKQKRIVLQILIFVVLILSNGKVFATSIADYA